MVVVVYELHVSIMPTSDLLVGAQGRQGATF
uniref:Uncharacterized protein n=1 Tax=Arundo donax TaxID=35708 RepID=A0A0A9BGF4_ARUDO